MKGSSAAGWDLGPGRPSRFRDHATGGTRAALRELAQLPWAASGPEGHPLCYLLEKARFREAAATGSRQGALEPEWTKGTQDHDHPRTPPHGRQRRDVDASGTHAHERAVCGRDGARARRGRGKGIHGTNQPSTIGTFVSSGCIRLTNRDIMDLYTRVHVGTRTVVLAGWAPATTAAPLGARPPAEVQWST